MPGVEITWFGETCVRLRGREGVVAADAYRSVVGPTGRGLTADIVTYSHADSEASAKVGRAARSKPATEGGIVRPTSLESAFYLDAPGEYEIHDVLIGGVRTFRDDVRGAERGLNTSFVIELDGLHAVHMGDVGHLLSEETLGEIGSVDIACVTLGSGLSAARAAELVAQLDANLVVPLPLGSDAAATMELDRFLKEMGAEGTQPVSKLSVSFSTVPQETTVVVLEPRGRT
jgi:L-ascorbate metabolism protein UlaG (beta-lactamase superfamily)